MVGKLRATETRLSEALANRGTAPLINSMHNDEILKRALLVNKLRLDRVFPLPGMQKPMKAIMETYNAKFPGLEAGVFSSIQKAMRTASRNLTPGETLRGTTMLNSCHAVAVEFRCHRDNHISMIVLEPMYLHPGEFLGCADALGKTRHNQGNRIHAALFCGVNVQKDHSSCAGYTKDFLKEFHRNESHFAKMHALVRDLPVEERCGRMPADYARVSEHANVFQMRPESVPDLLPPALFKNLQSAQRLEDILRGRPELIAEPINSKGETIPDRLQRLTGKEWVSMNPRSGRYEKNDVSESDKVVPMAENYRRMHGKAADFGETGRVRPPRSAPR